MEPCATRPISLPLLIGVFFLVNTRKEVRNGNFFAHPKPVGWLCTTSPELGNI